MKEHPWHTLLGLLLAISVSLVTQANGQESQESYPSRPVTLLVQHSPGSAGDLTARTLADTLTKRWGAIGRGGERFLLEYPEWGEFIKTRGIKAQ
ncbi:hypothetical protein [Cupriavidus basilensis]|uniref:hypothetical protein n=1 Tax=Cupriavidus basilensis TaxID=68895 RepID=UPI0023E7DB2A|nr:hypothetical protein [Cupriavidus basilensis]MDF3883010.1 hypothetical protein [Cupriavidus basilensis]